ncbi:hypothetical protein [Nocardiopsis sp. NRRL B-16309]|uniref:hypothetical protein n=1 Tax=Nocardiopsis sp. NRRL B-16309 TaxID=1519494 RepID=UPI0006AF46F5|nr:hypothetical protein [Nocardiopsis sp. NRRL B-16309]KOX10236.1 hypothetical protein ADL05_26615 [Nocardiopsis sp. NRRL B-16309]
MTKKITAPAGAHAHGAFNPFGDEPHTWFVDGVAYVADDSRLLAYFGRKGYTVDDDATPPSDYTARAAAMAGETTVHGAGDSQDAMEPTRRYTDYRNL